MNRRAAFALALFFSGAAMNLVGCSSNEPTAPPAGGVEATWTDEVKASEAAREADAKARGGM